MAYNIKRAAGNAARAVGSALFPKAAGLVNAADLGRQAVMGLRNKNKAPASPFTVMSGAKPQAGQSFSVPQQPPTIGLSPSRPTPAQAVKRSNVAPNLSPRTGDVSWGIGRPSKPVTALSGTPLTTPETFDMPEFASDSYTSDDAAVRDRVKEMSAQAEAKSGQAPIATANVAQPQQNKVIDALRSKIGKLSGMSEEERALSDQLAQFRGDAAKAEAGLEGQGRGIPIGLIRGQQGLLNTQNQLQEQTLMDRLASASAARQAELQAAENEYNIAAAEQARQDQLTSPTTVGNQILQFDPNTGTYKTLYSAPETADTSKQPASVQEYEYARQNGYSGSFMDYQKEKEGVSAADQKAQLQDQKARENALTALNLVIDLQDDPGIRQAVGLTGFIGNIPGNVGANYRTKIKSLQSALALPALEAMRGMGALSDADVRLLQQSQAALSTSMSVEAFEAELQRIRSVLESKTGSGGGGNYDDIDQYLNSFSDDLSTSRNGSNSWGNIGNLSEKFESGGNPGAIGYDSTGGYSYGTYQLAHNNAKTFIEQSPYAKVFAGLKFNSPEWRRRWQQVAKEAPQQFAQAQKQFIAKTHFEPQVNKLQQKGINVAMLPAVVKDAIWSTAVQHGANTDVVTKAFSKLPKNASPADMLKAIYKERWAGGARFASSTPAVKKAVFNRFFGKQGELALALQRLQTQNVG